MTQADKLSEGGLLASENARSGGLSPLARAAARFDLAPGTAHFDAMLREAAQLSLSPGAAPILPVFGELVQGKYRIEARLGMGGMGVVLRATHVETGKPVALKWLLTSTPHAEARFVREASAAAKIDHANVVNVFDVGMHRGARYLVMELLRGESLGARLRREGSLPPRAVLELMLPVLRGLAAVHAAGVIHRDLKPDNIFLCAAADGSAREPKLLDFGVSKLNTPSQAELHLTGEGCAVGTLAYMSPEQARDAPNVDARTDIYAAGVVLYEALTGRLPEPSAPYEVSRDASAPVSYDPCQAAALFGSRAEPRASAALMRVVSKAMARDADQRHASVEALLADLRACGEAQPAELVPEAVQYAGKMRRLRGLRALGLAAALGLLGLLWFRIDAALHSPGQVLLAHGAVRVASPRAAHGRQATPPPVLARATQPEAAVVPGPAVPTSAAPDVPAISSTAQRDAPTPVPRPRIKARAGAIRLADL